MIRPISILLAHKKFNFSKKVELLKTYVTAHLPFRGKIIPRTIYERAAAVESFYFYSTIRIPHPRRLRRQSPPSSAPIPAVFGANPQFQGVQDGQLIAHHDK
jgi:hypothetical protein